MKCYSPHQNEIEDFSFRVHGGFIVLDVCVARHHVTEYGQASGDLRAAHS